MTPILKPVLLAALAINVAIGIGAAVRSQVLTLPGSTTVSTASTNLTGLPSGGNLVFVGDAGPQCVIATANGAYAFVPCGQPQRPAGAIFHQVTDRYFDADGNQLDIKSATHAIDADCQPGRRQQDLLAQDDGKGRVQFAQTRLPSEPATGQKPVTKEGMIKATLAIKANPPSDPATQLAEVR